MVDNATVAVMKEDPRLISKPELPIEFGSDATSPLKYEVQLGANQIDVDLNSKTVTKQK
jgi:hypothetical protein